MVAVLVLLARVLWFSHADGGDGGLCRGRAGHLIKSRRAETAGQVDTVAKLARSPAVSQWLRDYFGHQSSKKINMQPQRGWQRAPLGSHQTAAKPSLWSYCLLRNSIYCISKQAGS